MTTDEKKNAISPWESSEEIFTNAATRLGLSKEFHFEVVLGLDGPLPKGAIALIVAYPTPSDYEEQVKPAASSGALAARIQGQYPDAMWLPQKKQNACGPHALLHAIFNSSSRDHVGEFSHSES